MLDVNVHKDLDCPGIEPTLLLSTEKLNRLLCSCRVKANCPFVGPEPVGGVPTVGGLSNES